MPKHLRISSLPLCLWLGLMFLTSTGSRAEENAFVGSAESETAFAAEPAEVQAVSAVVAPAPKNEWLVAPVPSRSPGQGFGLQLVTARLFRTQSTAATTPPSMLGVAAKYTENKSYQLGLIYKGHLSDDRWRVLAGGGYVLSRSDYYGVDNSLGELGLSIPLEQTALAGLAQATYRIRPSFYAGVRVLAAHTEVEADVSALPPIPLPDLALKADMYAAGPVVQWDTRDNTFTPTRGLLVNARLDIFTGTYDYNAARIAVNGYQAMAGGVLAWRGYAEVVGGDVPFFALCSFGSGSDLRGYINGQYRDRALLAGQAEYRRPLNPRWTVVAFAGVGQVAPSLGAMSSDRLLASAGGGIRFRLTKENPVNFRCDYAWGRDGGALYFGVGEAF